MERTTEENKELRFIAAKEKLVAGILLMREASLLTERDVDFEILNTILETFDGCTKIKVLR